ncbi:MAG: hypothetical protein MUC49_14780 [Raineya sp.]|jgi:hypothetical protein|nr:hypothetical protein [Raineya sp.]
MLKKIIECFIQLLRVKNYAIEPVIITKDIVLKPNQILFIYQYDFKGTSPDFGFYSIDEVIKEKFLAKDAFVIVCREFLKFTTPSNTNPILEPKNKALGYLVTVSKYHTNEAKKAKDVLDITLVKDKDNSIVDIKVS